VSVVRFLWDFVVGDDWVAAAGVIVGLGVLAAARSAGVALWWLLPLWVLGTLSVTLRRAVRRSAPQAVRRSGQQ
jgi:hypothetical protein